MEAPKYTISADQFRMDLDAIHGYLTRSYWVKGITKKNTQKCIDHSFCFGVFLGDKQVGFARAITDFTRFVYLADVFILEEHQGKGLGKQLVEKILAHPKLQNIGVWLLATKDAHELYKQYGFTLVENNNLYMEIRKSPFNF